MASARSAGDNFLCCICHTVFTKPVSIPCGHNFCLDCITDYWDRMTTVFPCPLCKEEFHIRPTLRVNTFIAELTAHFQKRKSSAVPEHAGKVLCGVCTGERCTALKSCLVCFMSYCRTHLEPHQRISVLKKHKLIDPVENLESRICQKHDEPLGLFCIADQMFVCDSCKHHQHKKHRIVTLEEMAEMIKTQLGGKKTVADGMIQTRQQKIQEIQNSVEASRTDAGTALSCNMHVMSAVVEHIKRCQAQLNEVIETKQSIFENDAHRLIQDLEVEILQVKQTNSQLDQVLNDGNPFTLHERFRSLRITESQVKDWSGVNLKSEHFSLQGAMTKLETTVKREVSTLCDPDLKEKQQHAVEVTLDPDTANVHLTVSADGKQVAGGGRMTNLPNIPQRFAWGAPNVLAKEGFSSGKFYYEVQVKNRTQWKLGVVKQSVNRTGEKRLGPQTGYWMIWLKGEGQFIATEDPWVDLHKRETLQRVGIFVDCEAGQVSFYDVDARVKIFTFTGYYFAEKLFPFFSLCSDTCKNSAPLIITPVKYA
ncbi:E3 ubiquitin-protein ligase TRIM39-like [Solea solea]|uniref:E3 ubiquitin-protein ligase TRIM39-like n=1 Tax=Solea solea TaxID=90069 RepID=UPI00272D2210|nr:E3 ubiquitin-protein ligase TRIM39-like [Solea solea]